jgi:lipopolysaccharide export system protein LptA
MSWQRGVRLAAAGVGLATALAIVLLMRDRPAPVDRGVTAPLDPEAALQTGRGVDVRYRGGERQAWIASGQKTVYKDGRAIWKDARVNLADGTVLAAGTVESVGEATTGQSLGAEMRLRDGVRLEMPDTGATLAAETAVYNDQTGEASIPGAVTFTRGRVSGRGTGATYARDAGIFHVLADVVVTLAAEPPATGIEVTAATMTFTSATRSMLFDRQARITRATEVLSANRATLFLSDDDQQFRAIELRGQSRVEPAKGNAEALPAMEATDIDLSFHDGTQALRAATLDGAARLVQQTSDGPQSIEAPRVELQTAADGRTLTGLRGGPSNVVVRLPPAAGQPAREIRSATLAATGTEQAGLLNALFTDAVRFTEQVAAAAGRAPATREGRSRLLSLELEGRLNAVKTATFSQNVTFESKSAQAATTAHADVGVYNAARGELILTPFTTKPTRLPRVSDGEVTVDASARITVDLNTDALHAQDNVKTSSVGKKKGAPRGFFTPGEPVRGAAASFSRDPKTQRLSYTGAPGAAAWLQQGEDSRVEGQTIVLDEDTGDLSATGQIRSTVQLVTGRAGARDGPAKPTEAPARYLITGETMQYVDKQRAATYTGTPVVLQRLDGERHETRSSRLVVTLARDERRLEQLDATGEMRATLEAGREALGDRLIYDAAADRYTISGRPALIRTRNDDGTCSRARGLLVRFHAGDGGHEWPREDNPGGHQSGPYSCTEPLR